MRGTLGDGVLVKPNIDQANRKGSRLVYPVMNLFASVF